MDIAVLDYGLGNLGSITNMLRKLGANPVLEGDPSNLDQYPALILPGVGSFDSGVRALKAAGLDEALKHYVANGNGTLLGICLGMQMLMDSSAEGLEFGLGFIPGRIKRFDFSGILNDTNLKTPHMGWNEVKPISGQPSLFYGLEEAARFYFVHSYHAVCDDDSDILAKAYYGYDFACSIGRGNVFGAQFHPEKSHRFGMQFFKNFLAMVDENAS